ncbi:MAG: Wzz/FepE/Etk N-terminal domain-containing protein [Steroidobacteraceae bacterium]
MSEVLRALRARKWLISVITLAFLCVGAAYAWLATPRFLAKVEMIPVDHKSLPTTVEQLSGLASLAGLNIDSNASAEPLAVLKSRNFAREFIEEQKIESVLIDDEGRGGGFLRIGHTVPKDMRDAVRLFDEHVRSVAEDKKSELVTISILWKDPDIAADWANKLATMVNERTRHDALLRAERNVEFLREEMQSATVVSLQQSIGRVLESEMQKLMLARGEDEYSFRVIDRAVPPKKKVSPRRLLILFASLCAGFFGSSAYVWLTDGQFRRRGNNLTRNT